MHPALSALGVLTLVGLALFAGGLFLRRLPGTALAIGAVIVGFGLGIPAIVIDDNRADTGGGGGTAAAEGGDETTSGSGEEAAGSEGSASGQAGGGAAAEGKLIFTQTCGTCHVLKDAGTSGQVGPPLDTLKPNKAGVEVAIEKGGSGSGAMPAGLLAGKEAEAVAEYVASVAGK